MQNLKLKSKNLKAGLIFITLCFTGCATAPSIVSPPVISPGEGIYHKVEKGETLWRISKKYGIDVDDLASLNKISDTTKIEIGQQILVPRKQKLYTTPDYSTGDEFIWPIDGKVVSTFNQNFDKMLNKGIDIQPYSSTNILASRGGKVVFASHNFRRFGKTVILDHYDGYLTVYANNSELLVTPGSTVKKGDIIARLNLRNGSYLHFEVRKGHIPKNPLFYLP